MGGRDARLTPLCSLSAFDADRERRLGVPFGVGAEGDVRRRPHDASDLVEPIGDHVRQVLMVANAYHRDEVGVSGHGVDLGDPVQLGYALTHLRNPIDVAADHDDGGDHGDD